ncbi:anti sigma factor C-terminal domain-containing protein [Rummeliibacillus pycnus]|uniref:anti-sigma factor n=1 Tax=Rummeliibacillus pycnus TaxID=101070 RepID=UPI003D297F92
MDDYEKLLQQSKNDLSSAFDGKKADKILKKSVEKTRWTLILGSITAILLIVPIIYLFTFLYYSFGTQTTTLMDVVSDTLYVTDPNTSLKKIEFDMSIKPLSMQLQFEQYKRIGEEDYKAGTYKMNFLLNNLNSKSFDSNLERVKPKYPTENNVWIVHPKNVNDVNENREWQVVNGLPKETVVEAYLSFDKLMSVKDVQKKLPNVDVVWAAVDTGVEEKNLSKDGDVVSPIGFPTIEDKTYWSPFNSDKSHETVFKEILNNLQKHEETAVAVSNAKNLDLAERIDYINKNGIKTYGVVVTGPAQEIAALEKVDFIRKIKIGEVKLWNWSR